MLVVHGEAMLDKLCPLFLLPSSSYLFACLLTHSIRATMLSILRAPYGLNIRWLLTTSLGRGLLLIFSGRCPHCPTLAAYLLIYC